MLGMLVVRQLTATEELLGELSVVQRAGRCDPDGARRAGGGDDKLSLLAVTRSLQHLLKQFLYFNA